MKHRNIGIWGIGAHLPEPIRTNAWWSDSTVERWRARPGNKLDRPTAETTELSDGARLTLAAMAELRHDPFRGAVERRVLPEDQLTSVMEVAAAKEAIGKAGIDPKRIGAVLSMSTVPDLLHVPNATVIHQQLGLRSDCFALQTEGMCNAFLLQLTLATRLLEGRPDEFALLTQSSTMTRLMRPEEPFSPWFGDGATAVVVGPVQEGYGLLATAHETDGEFYHGLVTGVPGRRWYEEGRIWGYLDAPENTRRLLLAVVDRSRVVVGRAFEEAGVALSDVDFYASHQGTPWLRRVTQQLIGIEGARHVDTFPMTASLLGANLPMVLAMAEREGSVRDGNVVAMFAGASGMICTGAALRWGR